MGAVQKLATVVIVGLVALATVLVIYLANEGNRRDDEVEAQEDVAVERAIDTYVTNCLVCHGPAGEGYSEPGAEGTGRVGAPLGGQTEAGMQAIERNQSTDPAAWNERREAIWMAIQYGRPPLMPAWGRGGGGQLNDEQIDELILMIHTVDWDRVYNHAIEASGGYPTPPAAPQTAQAVAAGAGGATPRADTSGGGTPSAGGTPAAPGGGGQALTITAGQPQELAFDPAQVTIPADTDVTVTLPNEGALPHNFSIDALSISVDIPTGGSEETTVNAAPGDYEYYCDIPGHKEGGMVGTLTAE